MRIGLVSSSSGSRGGGELYLVGLANGLANLGHEVCAVLAAHPRMDELAELLAPFTEVRRIAYRNTYDRLLRSLGAVCARGEIQRLSQELEQLPVDLLHINKQNQEDGLDLLLAAERTGKPVLATVHQTKRMRGLRAVGSAVRDGVSQRVLRRVSAPLLAVSRSGQEDLAELGIASHRLKMVWNGVPQHSPASRERLRSQWEFGPNDFILGCVARLTKEKNPLFLLELLRELPSHVRLVWIGDGAMRGEMEHAIRQQELSNRVALAGWSATASSDVSGLDVFVLPSQYEGLPLSILEAMAAGRVCIASDVGGVGEAIVHEETGFLCPAGDKQRWLHAINRCLEQPERLAEMGRLATNRYRQHFSIEAMAKNTAAIYAATIETWKGRHAMESVCPR